MNDVNAIVRDHARFARSIAQRFGGWLMPEHMDDFTQAAMIGVAKAAETYDPARGSFITWAFPCARSAVVNELRRHQRHGFVVAAAPGSSKLRPRANAPIAANGSCSLRRRDTGHYHLGEGPASACARVPESLTRDPWAELEARALEADLVARALEAVERLPARAREVMQARIDGEPVKATAERFGVSHQRVSQIFAAARERVLSEVRS